MTEVRSCVKAEVAVLGSPSLTVWTVSIIYIYIPSILGHLATEVRSCVKAEVAVLGSPSLTVCTVCIIIIIYIDR